MKIGIISDTHTDKIGALKYIVHKAFLKQGVELIIHCGDIIPEHIDSEIFGYLPVICALIEEQMEECGGDIEGFCPHGKPSNWDFTTPGDRIRKIGNFYAYIGHKRSFEFLLKSEHELWKVLHEIRMKHNNVRYLFSGHTHHQIMLNSPLITFINPGAVEDSFGTAGGYEFAILDTETDDIVFNRIMYPQPIKQPLRVGVISDSFDISEMDPTFWRNIKEKFKAEKVTHVIHCGNISMNDIGHSELADFHVYCNLRPDQCNRIEKPDNWELLNEKNPIVDINGYRFCVQLNIGPELFKESEVQMQDRSMDILLKHPETKFLLCGHTRNAFYEEGQGLLIVNPGDVIGDKDYVIINLPCVKLTFGKFHPAPLPPL